MCDDTQTSVIKKTYNCYHLNCKLIWNQRKATLRNVYVATHTLYICSTYLKKTVRYINKSNIADGLVGWLISCWRQYRRHKNTSLATRRRRRIGRIFVLLNYVLIMIIYIWFFPLWLLVLEANRTTYMSDLVFDYIYAYKLYIRTHCGHTQFSIYICYILYRRCVFATCDRAAPRLVAGLSRRRGCEAPSYHLQFIFCVPAAVYVCVW